MHATRQLLALLVVVFVAGACTEDSTNDLVGEWTNPSGSERISFHDDGSFGFESDVSVTGTYAVDGSLITMTPDDPQLEAVAFTFYVNEQWFAREALLAQDLQFDVVGTWQGQATLDDDLLTYTLTLKDDGTASTHSVGAGIDYTSDTVFMVADDVLTLGEVGTESEERYAIIDGVALSQLRYARVAQ